MVRCLHGTANYNGVDIKIVGANGSSSAVTVGQTIKAIGCHDTIGDAVVTHMQGRHGKKYVFLKLTVYKFGCLLVWGVTHKRMEMALLMKYTQLRKTAWPPENT